MAPRTPVTVRPARRDDLDELAVVLGRAFDDDPVMEFVFHRRPVAPRAETLMYLFALLHFDHDGVFVAEDPATGAIIGGTVWAPPGHWQVPMYRYLPHFPKLLKAAGLRGLTKIPILSAMEKHHPRDPHQYLAVIGTDPDHQGKGIGTALLEPMLAHCDETGLPAYLESSKESNVPYYARFGFEVTQAYPIPNGPSIYFMWRPAPA